MSDVDSLKSQLAIVESALAFVRVAVGDSSAAEGNRQKWEQRENSNSTRDNVGEVEEIVIKGGVSVGSETMSRKEYRVTNRKSRECRLTGIEPRKGQPSDGEDDQVQE